MRKSREHGEMMFAKVKEFYATYGCPPAMRGYTRVQRKAEPEERLLGIWLNNAKSRPGPLRDAVLQWYDTHRCVSPAVSREDILVFAVTHHRRPSRSVNADVEEQHMAQSMESYSSSDKDFSAKMEALAPKKVYQEEVEAGKVVEFVRMYGRRPLISSEDKEERRLASSMSNIVYKSSSDVGNELRHELESLFPTASNQREKFKQEIVLFVKIYNYRPSSKSKDPYEALLGNKLDWIIHSQNKNIDLEFKAQIEALRMNKPVSNVAGNKEAILAFASVHHRRPSQNSTDPEEARLASRMGNYIYGSCRDAAFAAQLNKMCPTRAWTKKQKPDETPHPTPGGPHA
jgi:sulfur relay (sulfurtransferase) DsrC/TusE family protein